jgi:hypothetical protein
VCSLAGLQISKLSGVSGGGGFSCLEHQPTCLNKAPCRDKRYPREGNINWGLTVYGIKNKKNPLAGGYNTRQLQVMLEIRRGGHNEGEKRMERERERKNETAKIRPCHDRFYMRRKRIEMEVKGGYCRPLKKEPSINTHGSFHTRFFFSRKHPIILFEFDGSVMPTPSVSTTMHGLSRSLLFEVVFFFRRQ